MLKDSLVTQTDQAIELWRESRHTDLRTTVNLWRYNDTGLICAHLRAIGMTKLAERIEQIRFK